LRHNRLIVADLRAARGKRMLSMLFVETPDEAAAGECFVQVGFPYRELVTPEDCLRAAFAARAAGKTAASAPRVRADICALEEAGAVAVELEAVPARVGAELSRRPSLVTFGLGAGSGADAQYLLAEDVLGYTRGHKPRHARTCRNFAAEHARLQAERIAAFGEFVADVESGAYPGPEHDVTVDDAEFEGFLRGLPNG
jgi:3-methyl-2-oxobutanoate hydroxymethyltransferase